MPWMTAWMATQKKKKKKKKRERERERKGNELTTLLYKGH